MHHSLFFFFFCRASICFNPVWEAEETKEATYYPFSEEVDEPSHPEPRQGKARASRGQSVNVRRISAVTLKTPLIRNKNNRP
ncbi:hypothetical protein CesoFtcFv8_009742 [Champsocephalus esox]|uniref:Secreted protein n=1 Tax=Champsocephalus esox TaxID=159716 RepID=A0AAN8C4C3_9TELE|nr:hypothetical protein CesoFtcFv8_009742 [Champsocephalus esox]